MRGYETTNPIENMAYPIVLNILGLVLTLLLGFLICVIRQTQARNFFKKYMRKLLYNFYIRLFL